MFSSQQPFSSFNTSTETFIGIGNSTALNCSAFQPIFDAYYPAPSICLSFTEFQDMIDNETVTPLSISVTLEELNCTAFEQFFIDLNFSNRSCLNNAAFIDGINRNILYFGIITIAVFIFGSIQVLTYQVSAERQVYKMRLSYYRAVLRQNIAWFDENASGAIASRLAE